MISTEDLPIRQCLPEILAAFAASIPVVLKAPPGAGKTTGVPPALMGLGTTHHGKILLVQPRRLAARSAASRLAGILGTRIGDAVGYQVRFDNQTSKNTTLIAMTTGILLRRLQNDPLLADVSCVILDEFHERTLEMELALGMIHRIRTTLRPELRLLVMSATLDPHPLVEFLGEATAVTSEGRSYPVDIRYVNTLPADPLEQRVATTLLDALKATPGHVLVFLPGLGEIRKACRKIASLRLPDDVIVCELYGDLSPNEQDAVLSPSKSRKIILATNVAETSITIPGVTCVIDSGLARVLRYDSNVGLPKLQLEPVSQASADQRTGRAGRTAPGVCYRLWSLASQRARRECDTPEIERSDFSEALLTLAAWGERDVFDFPWLTPPPKNAVVTAKQLLLRLEAIQEDGSLTSMGRHMLRLPLHPRLSRFMIEALKQDVVEDAALAAAMLSERDPFFGQPRTSVYQASSTHDCDVIDRVDRLKNFECSRHEDGINPVAAKQVRRVAEQIRRLTVEVQIQSTAASESDTVRLKRSLLAAYPDRVARRRNAGSDRGSVDRLRGVMVGGRGVRLDPASNSRQGELFLCLDVDSTGTEAMVRWASSIDEQWLHSEFIHEEDEPFFNPTLNAVVSRRRRYFDDLMLSEWPIKCVPSAEVGDILAQHALQDLETVFPCKDESVAAFVERVRFLAIQMPELGLSAIDDGSIQKVLRMLCRDRTSIAELRVAPWIELLRAKYDYSQLWAIEQHSPSRLTLPSGNSIVVNYPPGQTPYIEARIQEIYGWHETPRLAGGRVPLQLRLLGPNYRPQQITNDLASFWRVTYTQIRKELQRRYPKHYWPDDPAVAKATRNGLKPK